MKTYAQWLGSRGQSNNTVDLEDYESIQRDAVSALADKAHLLELSNDALEDMHRELEKKANKLTADLQKKSDEALVLAVEKEQLQKNVKELEALSAERYSRWEAALMECNKLEKQLESAFNDGMITAAKVANNFALGAVRANSAWDAILSAVRNRKSKNE